MIPTFRETLKEYLKNDMFPVIELVESYLLEAIKSKEDFLNDKKELPIDNDLLLKEEILIRVLKYEGILDIEGYIRDAQKLLMSKYDLQRMKKGAEK